MFICLDQNKNDLLERLFAIYSAKAIQINQCKALTGRTVKITTLLFSHIITFFTKSLFMSQ